nr:12444_t:CDS:1 [Entrophospora candida]
MNKPPRKSYIKYSTKVNFSYPVGQYSFQIGRLGIEDSYITGTLHLQFDQDEPLFAKKIILKFIGNENVSWTERRTNSAANKREHTASVTYSANNVLCCLTTCLLETSNDSYQKILNMDFPFKFKLPENIPSSLNAGAGNVDYMLIAEISRKRNILKFQKSKKRVSCYCNILKYYLLPPPIPIYWVEYDTKKAIELNGLGYDIRMDGENFGPSNPIIVYAKLKLYNPKLKIKEIFVGLKKYCSFKAEGNTNSVKGYVLNERVVGDTITWDNYNEYYCVFTLNVPEDLTRIGQTFKHKLVFVTYKIKMKIKKVGIFNKNINLEHNVRIDRFLPVDY